MRAAASLVVTLVIALAAAAAASASPQYVPSIVTLDGVGDVRPGQSVTQVEQSFGLDLRPETISPGCAQAFFRSGSVRGHALFIRGRLGSLWFDHGVIAGRGIAVGASFAALKRAYRVLEIRRDAYVPAARNAFVRRTRAPHWRLRFDVSAQGRVTRIAFGDGSTYRTEGCA
jgi:hypothetical protein